MSFWDDFSGASASRDIRRGRDTALGNINTGTDAAMGQFSAGISRLDPYAQGGQEGLEEYLSLMGLRGPDAQKAAQGRYQNNPINNALIDMQTRGINRSMTGRGMGNSGPAYQANANAVLGNYNSYLDRWSGLGQQGLQAAGAQSGINSEAGNTQFAAGQQRAGINTSAANGLAASRSTLTNNVIGVGSVIASAMTGAPPMRRPGASPGGANALIPGGVGAVPY